MDERITRPYTGELATKIEGVKGQTVFEQMLSDGTYESGALTAHIPAAWSAKLPLLIDHFGIDHSDPDRWFFVAFFLALKHVPGFAIDESEPAGAKTVWDGQTLARLYLDVNDLLEERRQIDPKFSEASACAILERRAPWSTLSRSKAGGTLRRRYQDAKKTMYVKLASAIATELAEKRSGLNAPSIEADLILRCLAGLTPMEQVFELLHGVISNDN